MSWVMFIVARKLHVRFLQVEGIRGLVIQIAVEQGWRQTVSNYTSRERKTPMAD